MSDYIINKTITIHKDDFAYISHPSISVLNDGRWIIALSHSVRRDINNPPLHPPEDPLFRNLLSRSADKGQTWEKPYFAPDFDWHGVETPGISQLSNGTLVLTQFRYRWYPLGLAKKRRDAGESISIKLPGDRDWTEEFTNSEWDDALYSWARGYDGLYSHYSTDNGDTFKTVRINTEPYHGGFTRTGVVELSDGRIIYPVTEHIFPRNKHTYFVTSKDYCRNWEKPSLIVESPDLFYLEPHIAEVGKNELYCILRSTHNGKEDFYAGYLYSCRSLDGGITWTIPEATPMYGHPGHLLVLNDGRLLCTYGRRHAPFGIRACLSEDNGKTWLIDKEIIIRDDFPNYNLGYPTTIEYEPGKLFVCYYGQQSDGTTCVQGTYVSITS